MLENVNVILDVLDRKMLKQISNGECPVCQDKFKLKQEIAIGHCSHYFHQECLGSWLSTNSSCPICRSNIDHTKVEDK